MNLKGQIWLGLIFLVFSVLFNPFNRGGVILGEPDEFIYVQMAREPAQKFIPYYSGQPFFSQLPLMPFLAGFLNFLTGDSLFSLRLISFFATLGTALLIFFYVRSGDDCNWVALAAVSIFLFNLLTVFYSQVGILDPLMTFFLFGSTVFFLKGSRTRFYYVSSGVFLTLSLLTKYTALIFLPLFLAFFLIRTLKLNISLWKKGEDKVFFDPILAAVFLIPGVFLLIIWFYYHRVFPWEFKLQITQILGLDNQGNGFNLLANLNRENLRNLISWFGGGYWGLFLGGLLILVRKLKNNFFLLVICLSVTVSVFSRVPFYPRYTYLLLPFYSLIIVYFLDFFKKIRVFRRTGFLFFFLYFAVLAPALLTAYSASKHRILEEALDLLPAIDRNASYYLLSNYWPNILGSLKGTERIGWLTLDNKEQTIFNPKESRTGREIIETGPAYILVEDYYSKRQIVVNEPRYQALKEIEKLTPWRVIGETSPNFPFFEGFDSIAIYKRGVL